jgi:hypothetical protein
MPNSIQVSGWGIVATRKSCWSPFERALRSAAFVAPK